jgi:hypothetical protein
MGVPVFRGLRPRLTYANVVSSLCLFVLLGGGAYASQRYLITSKDQIKPSVRAQLANERSTLNPTAGVAKKKKVKRGPAGPQGSQGVPGPKGDPGSARAYAHVTRTVTGGFVLDTARSKNVVNVVLPATLNSDRPCVVLPASIDASTAVAIGTVDAQHTDSSETAEVQHRVGGESAQECSGNSLALWLKRNGAGSTNTIAFNVLIP